MPNEKLKVRHGHLLQEELYLKFVPKWVGLKLEAGSKKKIGLIVDSLIIENTWRHEG